jgi:hypothetical protein
MMPLSSPNMWMNHTSVQNTELFRPIHTIPNVKPDDISYVSTNNSLGSITSTPTLATSHKSPNSNHHHRSKHQSSSDNHQRQRLHSGSSCYESDSHQSATDNDGDSEVKKN